MPLAGQLDLLIAEIRRHGFRVVAGVAGTVLYVAVLPRGYRQDVRALFAASYSSLSHSIRRPRKPRQEAPHGGGAMSGGIVAQNGMADAGEQDEFGGTTRCRSNPSAVLRRNEVVRRAMHHQQRRSNRRQAGQIVEGMTQQGAGW